MERLGALFSLANVTGEATYNEPAMRAANFYVSNMLARNESLLYEFWNTTCGSLVTTKDLCGGPCTSDSVYRKRWFPGMRMARC